VTFIPFVVILLIPLTPVGHVLVFGAIQRFFPNFFPSCFTTERQNLLKLFEQSEFKQIDVEEGVGDKLSRAVVGASKKFGGKVRAFFEGEESGEGGRE